MTTVFVHKVKDNPINGWGRNTGIQTSMLGRYDTKEKALEAKKRRDANNNARYCDVGESWIEEEIIE